ncbi:ABC transporter substrate-binding protein [Aerococcus christensenii]|uniref:ABC transporter substrate-binding protein n=1 Tax=Aerococcus christensenii TaxID=87541 RepID=UPI003F43F46B
MKLKELSVGLAVALGLTGCQSITKPTQGDPGSHDTIRLGGNWELTGQTSGYGVRPNRAIQLAVDQQNAKGGLLNKSIEYINYDTRSMTEDTVINASRLVSVEDVSIVFGTGSTNTAMSQLPTLDAAGVPLMGASLTGDRLTVDEEGQVRPNAFRVCFQDSFQGRVLANFSNQRGYKRAVIIKDNGTDYGQKLTDEFKKYYEGDIVAEESYVTKETDFNAVLTNIKQLKPDVIFVAGYYEEGGPLIQQARQLGIDAPILGPDGFGNEQLIKLAGAANTDHVFYVAHFVPGSQASEQVKAFQEAYKERYGEEPDQFAALGYDCARLTFDAMQRAQSDRPEDFKRELEKTVDYQGVTGKFTIDDHHNPIKSAFVVELSQGKIISATEIQP